ncbi:MAG: hypothetical protein JZU50_08285 [Desulfobulbaceae bacterium]|jgi:hypothetical protein|nr:hypothetical protein [Desulfobulbaceae bacterium]
MNEEQKRQILNHTAAGRTWLASAELSGVGLNEFLQVVMHGKTGRCPACVEFFKRLKQAGDQATASSLNRHTKRGSHA